MAKRIDPKLQAWIKARKRHRLSHAQVQMARELGLNPTKLGAIDNHRTELWKEALPQFIESLYLKRFGRGPAEPIRSIEEIAMARQSKKNKGRKAKAAQRSTAAEAIPVVNIVYYPDRKISETILDFGSPLLDLLPPRPPIEKFRQFLMIVITFWNFGTMAFSIWRGKSDKDYSQEMNTLLRTAGPELRVIADELLRRRASEPFRRDQRGVGEWSVQLDDQGGFIFRCDARLPEEVDRGAEPSQPG